MLTAAAILTSIYLNGLGVTALLPAFCTNMVKLSSLIADIVMLILKDLMSHVIILANSFFFPLP